MADDLREWTAAQIQTAFADTPYPGDERVAAYARYGRSIADALRGKHWADIPVETLFQHRWEIFLLNPETFRFYIPIFLLAALFHYDELDSLASNVIFSLTPQREEHIVNYFSGEYRDYFSQRVAAFSAGEKSALLTFLRTFTDIYPQEKLIYDIELLGVTIPFWERAVDTNE